MYKIIQTRKWWLGVSLILIAASLLLLIIKGLPLGLDFTGGSLIEVMYKDNRPEVGAIQQNLASFNLKSLTIQPSDNDKYLLRAESIDESTHQGILKALRANNQQVEELRFDSIGPTIGQELQHKALGAIMAVLIAIILYLTYAFRQVSKPVPSFYYGLAAIIALIHDLIICLGAFALMSWLVGWQADSLLITALLTVLGFSVHDTIVTFDRVRENLRLHVYSNNDFETVVNNSINQTIVRSINTSLTTLLVSVAIMLYGGGSVRPLAFVMAVGIVIGTYSSIFIASPVLLWVAKSRIKK